MAGTPKYKLFRGKEYVASCKHPDDAAALIAAERVNRVSFDRAVWLWTETDNPSIAAESYDEAVEIMERRRRLHHIKQARKLGYTDDEIITKLNHSPADVAAAQGTPMTDLTTATPRVLSDATHVMNNPDQYRDRPSMIHLARILLQSTAGETPTQCGVRQLPRKA